LNEQRHSSFEKELKELCKKHPQARKALEDALRMIAEHFNTIPVFDPGKLHRITQLDNGFIWKLEMAVPKSGLRPNQWPRVWFAIENNTLVILLLLAVHTDNYDNNACDKEAFRRYLELRQ
jgi:hypothetical protein